MNTSISQTRLGSFIEALFNVAIGFAINMLANFVILPLIGFHITLGQNLFIGVLYTVVSVARSYCVRRWFNARLHAAALRLAQIAEPMNAPETPSTPRSVLSQEQEVALRLVSECFGSCSPELLRFCKFLVVEKQGRKWLDESVNPNQNKEI